MNHRLYTYNKDTIVIYHGSCDDGFASALSAYLSLGDKADYYPGVYQVEPPNVSGKIVYLVDFSYKRPVIETMLTQAKSVTILDHHKSAYEDLQPLIDAGKLEGHFDMSKSGVGITWEYFHSNNELPPLFAHIQDSDLFKFALEDTSNIIAGIRSYPQNVNKWLDWLYNWEEYRDDLIRDGISIRRYINKVAQDIAQNYSWDSLIGGHVVRLANAPMALCSAVCNCLAKGEKFAASFYTQGSKNIYSLRSDEYGIDVSEVARIYGGGGHFHAAGFSVPITDNLSIAIGKG